MQGNILYLNLSKVKSKVTEGSDEESNEESEDEIGIKDKPEWDNKFFEILPKIINKDPEIYKENLDFFAEEEGERRTARVTSPGHVRDTPRPL